jgi:hypothetical protein
VNAVPPGIEAPAAGIVKRTSANTRGQDASRKKTALDGRIVKVCALSAKRMTCCRVRFCGRIIVRAMALVIGKVGIRCDADVDAFEGVSKFNRSGGNRLYELQVTSGNGF